MSENKTSAQEKKTVLMSFGPTRPVPKGHRWCMACDGEGKQWDRNGIEMACEVCQGKGHWNNDDIRRYHERAPEICRQACGANHIDLKIDEK